MTSARQTVEIINRIYPLRKCETLQKDVCLYYHLGECLGYCKKNIDSAEIKQMTSEITSFLKGDASIVTNKLKAEMEQASASLNFEKALELKNMLDSIHVTLRHQKIDLNRKYNFDLLSFIRIMVSLPLNVSLFAKDCCSVNITICFLWYQRQKKM